MYQVQPLNIQLEPPTELLTSVFPWIEQEQDQLAQCQASSLKSVDIAFKQFLQLLIWLRQVLIQDAAILFLQYPTCPMFRYPSFNTPTFHNFAATSLSVVDRAEEEVRHALKNLPEHVAATFCALAMDIKMDQHSQCADTEVQWDVVDG
jgi:Centromere DNA-binding protein complex CBF3 subunit, domain 2